MRIATCDPRRLTGRFRQVSRAAHERMKIGVVYNLRDDFPNANRVVQDADAEWDLRITIDGILGGLAAAGHTAIDVGSPHQLLVPQRRQDIDLVFSICEMSGLRHREAQIPALCEVLQLPYVFSPPDAMITALDKNLANFLVSQAGGLVPDWQVAHETGAAMHLAVAEDAPLLVKPLAEGSGMGIDDGAVVYGEPELRARIDLIIRSYRQPALIQRYCSGPEFTIGVIETDAGAAALAPLMLSSADGESPHVYGYAEKENLAAPVILQTCHSKTTGDEVSRLALLAFRTLGCRDCARIDLRRVTPQGPVAFLEANPLPHLAPEIGDFCKSGTAAGMTYPDLLSMIVASAARRFMLADSTILER
jgi:D-alanine-D-alanine ligase